MSSASGTSQPGADESNARLSAMASEEGGGGGPPEKKRRILQACISCSSKRVKCDGQSPCGTCVRFGDACGYAVPKKRGPPKGTSRPARKGHAVASAYSSSSSTGGGGSSKPLVSTSSQARRSSQSAAQEHSNPTISAQAPTDLNHPMLAFSAPVTVLNQNSAHPVGTAALSASHLAPAYGQRLPDWNTGPASVSDNVQPQQSRQNSLASVYMPSVPDTASPNPNMHQQNQMPAPYSSAPMMVGQYDTAPLFNRNGAPPGQSNSSQPSLPPPASAYSDSRPPHNHHTVPQYMAHVQAPPLPALQQQQGQQHLPQHRSEATTVGVTPPPSSILSQSDQQHLDPSAALSLYTSHNRSSDPAWNGSTNSRRSAYPSSQQAASHVNLPLPRRSTHASVTPVLPAPPGTSRNTSNNSAHHGESNSSALSSAGASSVGVETAGGIAGETEAAGAKAPSRFFRGGTSGLYGLATRLRDRDRHGLGNEAVAGVVLRTYSGNQNDAEDIGEDEIDGSDRQHRERIESTQSAGGSSARRFSIVRSSEYPQHAPQYHPGHQQQQQQQQQQFQDEHGRQHSISSAIGASPLQSPKSTLAGTSEQPYMNLFHRRQSSVRSFDKARRQSSSTAVSAGWGAGGGHAHIGVPSIPAVSADQAFAAMASQRTLSPGAAHNSVSNGKFHPQQMPGQNPSGHRILPMNVQVGLQADPFPVSAAGVEDEPSLHEMIWKAATVGGRSTSDRPVVSALNEASGAQFTNEPVLSNADDLDDLEVAVGDVTAPDFTTPLVPLEVEQKLLHLWIANIATHWTPVACPTYEDIEAQPYLPQSDSEKHRNEAKIQQILAAWRAILQPNRKPLLWNAILSMAADAWGGDLTEAGYPTRASSSALSNGKGSSDEMEHAPLDAGQTQEATAATTRGAEGDEHVVLLPPRSSSVAGPATATATAEETNGHSRLMGKVRTGRELSTALFIRAKFFMQKTNQEAGLEAIQASIFMALRESGAGRASQAAHYSTNACRMALDLGLHRHKAVKRAMGAAFTRHEDECRRRTLWCTYMLDKVVAFILGRPAVLRSAEIDCPFPSEDLPDEEMPWVLMAERFVSPAIRDRMRGVPSMVASTAVWGAKLTIIGEKIIEQYNIVKPTNWQSGVRDIHNQLQEWCGTLKPAMVDRNKYLPHSMNQLMWYNTLRILLHRPHILKEAEPNMPSSHAECTDAVNQVCQLLSTYESFYNVRKVSTSLAFILFTSVTIALSNTTSSNAAAVAEAKQRLQELMRWFKKASENYRAARHHMSIINVLAAGIEIGTGGSLHQNGSSLPSADGQFVAQGPPAAGSVGDSSVQSVTSGGIPSHQLSDIFSTDEGQVTASFTGFAHSGVGYTYPAATLAAAQAAWRGNFGNAGNGGPSGGGSGDASHAGGSMLPVNGNVMGAGGTWSGSGAAVDQSGLHAGSNAQEGVGTIPQQQQTQGSAAAANPLNFLDSQAYLNLHSEAYWGAMPVSSENLLLWNAFHNEYISALAASNPATAAASATVENKNDSHGVGPQINGHGHGGAGAGDGGPAATMYSLGHGQANAGVGMPAASGVYDIFQPTTR